MTFFAAVPLAIWLYLLFGRGMFWRMRERDDSASPSPAAWPAVLAIVPARNEADVIAQTLAGLIAQDYPGPFRIVVVDDRSCDDTAASAATTAVALGVPAKVEIVPGEELPVGWTGKVWAMQQGLAHASEQTEFILFTDADIAHAPDNLRRLVCHAEDGKLVLVSLMARLSCESAAEKLLIPAFVFFFAMLFPFAWSNDSGRSTAAAAGGCMLVRRKALEAAGGLRAIAGEIIDDCALARALKPEGSIWLGLTNRARSVRPYTGLAEIRAMVARSAYAQLRYSPALLCGTILGMIIICVSPALLAIAAAGPARFAGIVCWIMMALAFQPILRFYGLSPIWGVAMPVIGATYAVFTFDSAVQHWRGRGGMWKGRAQAMA